METSSLDILRKSRFSGYIIVLVISALTIIGTFYNGYLLIPSLKYKSPVEPGFLCPSFAGRLGNHVWQYASLYSIAKKNGFTIILGAKDDLAQYFEVPSALVLENRDVCKSFQKNYTDYCCTFYEYMLHMRNNESYVLGQFLQSWRYFEGMYDEVRKELTFKKTIRDQAKTTVTNVRKEHSKKFSVHPVTVIGIHIRRGDIVSKHYNDAGIWPAPDTYIHHAIDYMQSRFNNTVYIVCSNDMDNAQIVTDYMNISVHYFQATPINDMALLAHTDHVIMTVGSYGWWGAFLSGGTVVYLKDPVEEGSISRPEYNFYDYYPPEWIALD